jgi:hypothetical protein
MATLTRAVLVLVLCLSSSLITALRSMATISNFQQENPQAVFDVFDHHLSLREDSLVSLTQAFLHEFKIGLNNYGQPMGMM